jgi:hypothetical protein
VRGVGGGSGLPQGLLLARRGLERPPPKSAAWAVCVGATCGAPEGAGSVGGARGAWTCLDVAWRGAAFGRDAGEGEETWGERDAPPPPAPHKLRRGTQPTRRFREGASPTPVAPTTDLGGGTRPHKPPAQTTLDTPPTIRTPPLRDAPRCADSHPVASPRSASAHPDDPSPTADPYPLGRQICAPMEQTCAPMGRISSQMGWAASKWSMSGPQWRERVSK